MPRQRISREELFALVWEKPIQDVATELGVSDVAIGKMCARLQVPKPPRGYWARVRSGQTPRRLPLPAFREEIDRIRRAAVRLNAAALLSKLQLQFYRAALSDLGDQGVDVDGADTRGGRLPNLSPDVAAQILLLIQNRRHYWVKEGKVTTSWGSSAQISVANLVGKLLPLARPQVLVFESEGKRSWQAAADPVVLVRLTACLQERIAALVRIVRHQKLQHVVVPLMAADYAWSARHVYSPESQLFLDSFLCVSATELWVECTSRAWREDYPPVRIATSRMSLQAIMPIDYMPVREVPLFPVVSQTTVAPYREHLRALLEAERVHEMMSHAAYAIEPEVPDERLDIADRIWFGKKKPFHSAREAWRRLEEELERWDVELEAERSTLAQSILGIEVGDIVTNERDGRLLRLSVTGTTLYASDEHVTFIVNGTRFRKDGTLGKLQDAIRLRFENKTMSTRKQGDEA
ncbi:MAG: hypothetical protein GEU87_12910 [Alphaproteobacteria bacterium]|nr:hypothetical protein [Alphaproteobacteria bacterium]